MRPVKRGMPIMKLYHTGFDEIKNPDIHRGRKNADFGRDFYLSPDIDFSYRWAEVRKDCDTYINTYELSLEDIKVKELSRDEEWFEYVFANRNGKEDMYADCDVIIGPIANDTIYDLFGITTSGFLSNDQALKILTYGPVYMQVAIKTEKGASALKFTGAEVIEKQSVEDSLNKLKSEEEKYLKELSELIEEIMDE